MMRELQVVFGIDMETDIGSWTPYYEGVTKGTPQMLDLFAKIHTSYRILGCRNSKEVPGDCS